MKIILIFCLFNIVITEEVVKVEERPTDEVVEELLQDAILKDLNKKQVSVLEYLDSKPGLISFWFIACEPCKKEMKYLDEFNKKYQDTGFKVISVNTDNSRTFNRVKPFVESKKYSFDVFILSILIM